MLDTGSGERVITDDFLANVEYSILSTKLTAKGAGQQTIEVVGVVFFTNFAV